MSVPEEPGTPKPQEEPIPPQPERQEPDRDDEREEEENDREDPRAAIEPSTREPPVGDVEDVSLFKRSEDNTITLTKEPLTQDEFLRSASAAATYDTPPPLSMTDDEIAWMVSIARQVVEGKEMHSGVQVLQLALARTVIALSRRLVEEMTALALRDRLRDAPRSRESL